MLDSQSLFELILIGRGAVLIFQKVLQKRNEMLHHVTRPVAVGLTFCISKAQQLALQSVA